MFPIILVFILRESVDRSNNPTSRRNMNSRNVWLCKVPACQEEQKGHVFPGLTTFGGPTVTQKIYLLYV